MTKLAIWFVLAMSGLLFAQAPQSSNQGGEVSRIAEQGMPEKTANLPGLDFYEEVVRFIQSGGSKHPQEVRQWINPGEPPAVRWFIQVHVAPSFEEDTLFTLRELTDETAEVVIVVPRGGINLWYQLCTPCLTEKPMTAEEAAKRLSYIRFQLTENEFPAVRRMVDEFKKCTTSAYPLADRYSKDGKRLIFEFLDGTSYTFKARSVDWSYDISITASDENPLISWAESCAETIWKFLKTDTTRGIPAHPIQSVDNNCIGQAILRAQAGAGEVEDVRRLIALGVPVDSKDYWDEGTPLQAAAEHYQLEAIRVLLKVGANPGARKEDGKTAFHLLPDRFTKVYKDGEPALSEWIQGMIKRAPQRLEIAEILRKAGASVDQVDKKGVSPLMEAVQEGDSLFAAWLLKHGANPVRKDNDGKSAVDRATGKRADMLKVLQGTRSK